MDCQATRPGKAFSLLLILFILMTINVSAEVSGKDLLTVKVSSNKILYRPGEEVKIEVVVNNAGQTEEKGTLRLREIRGLNESRVIGEENDVVIPPARKESFTFKYPLGLEEYGREVRVEFVRDGTIASQGAEFFSVADNWLRVSITSLYHTGEATGSWDGAYGNFYNAAYGALPDGWSYMAPKEDFFYSGFDRWPVDKKKTMAYVKTLKERGLKGIVYTYSAGETSGVPGFEFARQHPELMVRTKSGQYQWGGYSYFVTYNPLELAQPITTQMSNCYSATVDYYWPETTRYLADQILQSIKMFGWDGVWFDGINALRANYSWDGQPTPHGQDPNQLAVRNIKMMRELLRKEYPNLPFGYNLSTEFLSQSFESKFGNNGGWEAYQEIAGDKYSTVLQEWSPRSWLAMYKRTISDRDIVTQKNGQVLWHGSGTLLIPPVKEKQWDWLTKNRYMWVSGNHMGAIYTATQVHPWNTCYAGNPLRPTAQFMTRYSEFLWPEDVRTVQASAKLFSVQSARPLWWQETVYRKDRPEAVDYIVHLIQPAANDAVSEEDNQDPPYAENVVLKAQLPEAGKTAPEVWAMRAHDWGEAECPKQTLIPSQVNADGALAISVPPFRYHTMVVIRLPKAKP